MISRRIRRRSFPALQWLTLLVVALGAWAPVHSAPLTGARDWLEHGRIGSTSPLSRCRPADGCFDRPKSFPLLYVQVLTNRVLVVGLADQAEQGESPLQGPAGILSQIEPSTGVPSGIPIAKTGQARTTVGFTPEHAPLNERRLYLVLESPMQPGRRYRLQWASRPSFERLDFTFLTEQVTPAIQVNQVGYWPSMQKVGRVGHWLGTLGHLETGTAGFRVVDETGRTVHEGVLDIPDSIDRWSGQRVGKADFSALKATGLYRLEVEGLGRSAPFRIRTEVYAPLFNRLARMFYYSRNSTPISTPWADSRFTRPGGIPGHLSGRIHPAVPRSHLASGERAESFRAIGRGWFDAGDYGQYVVNAAPVWYAFSLGFDLLPAALDSDGIGMPESGNGIPDLLDELEWGMDWLLGMQDRSDGGVYSRLVPERWDDSLPHQVKKPRYFFEKTTHATASFAAATALHARLIRTYRPDRADEVLSAARAAWHFLENQPQWPAEGERYRNPPGVSAGDFADISALDNRAWAAAELYRSTREPDFLHRALELAEQVKIDNTRGPNFSAQGLAAYWALLTAFSKDVGRPCDESRTNQEAAWCRKIRASLIGGADWRIRVAGQNPWGAPLHPHIPYLGWGTFGRSSKAALPLLQAWRLTGEQHYLEAATASIHPQLGANPQSISYITGTGYRAPRYPLSKLSQYDGVKDPLPGIPVHGPHYQLPLYWPTTRAIHEAYIPKAAAVADPYPPLYRYVDSDLVPPMSEPTVSELALAVIAFGLLSDERLVGRAPQQPAEP